MVGEERVATGFGHLEGVEQRAQGRRIVIGDVGVPGPAEVHTLVLGLEDLDHFRAFRQALDELVQVQLAEAAANVAQPCGR